MSGTIYTKFFWADWQSDPALRLCSMAAQGFWMRLLCIAAEADPTGYVTVNGRPLDGQDLARATGVSEPEAETWLSELERNGVFSRDRRGCIYSRRMVRDAKKKKKRRKGIPKRLRLEIYEVHRRCQYCGAEDGPFEIDHYIPFSRGGSNARDNLVLACKPCNRSKRDKLVEEWMQ